MKTMTKQIGFLTKACITGLALFTGLGVSDVREAGINISFYRHIYTLLEQLQEGMEGNGLLLTVLILGLFLLYRKAWFETGSSPIRYSRIFAAFLAVMYVGGLSFYYGNSLSLLWAFQVNRIRAVIVWLGTYWLYLTCVNLLYRLLKKETGGVFAQTGFLAVCRRHPWLTAWCGLWLAWLPHLILRYPGAMSYDNWAQLCYYYGYTAFTTAQPVFHTWLFGTFVHAGVLLGHPNWGLFGFILFQSAVMAFVLSSMLYLMRRWRVNGWLRLLTMLIFCIAPYFTGYAAFPIKDYLYTAFVTAMVLMIMEYVREPAVFEGKRARLLLPAGWILCCSMMMLCRKNGLYIYLGTAALLFPSVIRLCRKKAERSVRYPALVLACLVLPLVLGLGTESVIIKAYGVQKDSPKEMFSLVFQQTARYVRDYGEEVTAKEKAAIAEVLDYESLPEIYNPLISDPVKTTYHADGAAELADYFKVWWKQFLKHPLCYVEATWNQNYSLFAPWTDNIVYNKDCYVGAELVWDEEYYSWLHFEVPEGMKGCCAVLVSLYAALTKMPVVGMFSNVAFYVILMFALVLFFVKDGRRRELKVMIPVLISFIFIILAPCILEQPRYAFPVIYAMPAVMGFYAAGPVRELD